MATTNTDAMNKSTGLMPKLQNHEGPLTKFSHDAGEQLGTMASGIVHSTSEYIESGREYVKENPVKGVALAATAGLVVGGLVTLALSRRH